ncbi:Vacuolar protein sorting-associated protein 60.2 [Vitis vinifera]|uniref:Vacuolar protein sorting-associated protein 60.2 n=1 Tax=Vitis vinifera TaxID=29760 RepID=A0A438E9W1_VITVI|nr:Vacuolar protein sorting-associated protein 60.2 [Vitis vinifera]
MKRVFGVKKRRNPLLQFKMLPIGANLKILVGELINKRGETVDEKITRLDAELSKYKEQIKRTRPGPAQEAVKARAMRVLKQKRMYEGQRDMLYNQTFNLDQVSFAAEGIKDAQQTVSVLIVVMMIHTYKYLCCKVGALPSSYLGLSLGFHYKFVTTWDGVEERFRKRKRKGGWSVRCLSAMNKALLCKWSWCFSNEKRAFWRQVISQKYGENEGEWHFSECEDEPLCVSFPSLFSIVVTKDVWVVDVWNSIADWGGWVPRFSRMFWMVSKSGKFSVKFLFSVLKPGDPFLFPWSIIWSSYVPPKALPSLVREMLLRWQGSFLGKGCKKPGKVVPLCIFWTVWKERNMLAFDNAELSVQRMKNSFVCNLWSWTRAFVNVDSSLDEENAAAYTNFGTYLVGLLAKDQFLRSIKAFGVRMHH